MLKMISQMNFLLAMFIQLSMHERKRSFKSPGNNKEHKKREEKIFYNSKFHHGMIIAACSEFITGDFLLNTGFEFHY